MRIIRLKGRWTGAFRSLVAAMDFEHNAIPWTVMVQRSPGGYFAKLEGYHGVDTCGHICLDVIPHPDEPCELRRGYLREDVRTMGRAHPNIGDLWDQVGDIFTQFTVDVIIADSFFRLR